MTGYYMHTKENTEMQKVEYKTPIKTDGLSDILAEGFDNLMSFMTEGSYLFSGAIATYFADQTLAKYVCMVVDFDSYKAVRRELSRSIYWLKYNDHNSDNIFDTGIECKNVNIDAKAIFTEKPGGMVKSESFNRSTYNFCKSLFGPSNNLRGFFKPSNNYEAFINTLGTIVILMCGDLEVIRKSGVSINGMVVDYEGQAYEIIPGAKNSCERKILRKSTINKNTDGSFIKSINNSFVNSGWKSNINVDGMCNAIEIMNKPKVHINKLKLHNKRNEFDKNYIAHLDALGIEFNNISFGFNKQIGSLRGIMLSIPAGITNLLKFSNEPYKSFVRNEFSKIIIRSICNAYNIDNGKALEVSYEALDDDYNVINVIPRSSRYSLSTTKEGVGRYIKLIRAHMDNALLSSKANVELMMRNNLPISGSTSNRKKKKENPYELKSPKLRRNSNNTDTVIEDRVYTDARVRVFNNDIVRTHLVINLDNDLDYSSLSTVDKFNSIRINILSYLKAEIDRVGLSKLVYSTINSTFRLERIFRSAKHNGIFVEFCFKSISDRLNDIMLERRTTVLLSSLLTNHFREIFPIKTKTKKIKPTNKSKVYDRGLDLFAKYEDEQTVKATQTLSINDADLNNLFTTVKKIGETNSSLPEEIFGEPTKPSTTTKLDDTDRQVYVKWQEIDGGFMTQDKYNTLTSTYIEEKAKPTDRILRSRFAIRSDNNSFKGLPENIQNIIVRDITMKRLREYICTACGENIGIPIYANMGIFIIRNTDGVITIETNIYSNNLNDTQYTEAVNLDFATQGAVIEMGIAGLMFKKDNDRLKNMIAKKYENSKKTNEGNEKAYTIDDLIGVDKMFSDVGESFDDYMKQAIKKDNSGLKIIERDVESDNKRNIEEIKIERKKAGGESNDRNM